MSKNNLIQKFASFGEDVKGDLLREAIQTKHLLSLFENDKSMFRFDKFSCEKLFKCFDAGILTQEQLGELCVKGRFQSVLFLKFKDCWSYNIFMDSKPKGSTFKFIGDENLSLFCKYNLPLSQIPHTSLLKWYYSGNSVSGGKYISCEVKRRLLENTSLQFKTAALTNKNIIAMFTEEELLQIPIKAKLLMNAFISSDDRKHLYFSEKFFEEIKKRIFKEILSGKYKNTPQLKNDIEKFRQLLIPLEERKNKAEKDAMLAFSVLRLHQYQDEVIGSVSNRTFLYDDGDFDNDDDDICL